MFNQDARIYPLFSEERGAKKAKAESITRKTNKNPNSEIEEGQKSIQEDRGIAGDENEDKAIRGRERSKITATLACLFGSIVCFIFKTAGSVISLLRQNARLLLM